MVDCGGSPEWISNLLQEADFEPDFLLLTHGHIDHILGLPHFAEAKTKVFIHPDDAHFLSEPDFNLSTYLLGTPFVWKQPVNYYCDLPKELGINVISTAGHTAGSVCLEVKDHLFSGDTLFCGGIGNTAFPGGDYATEVRSIQRLLQLFPQMRVHPGHGCSTTIEDEKNTI